MTNGSKASGFGFGGAAPEDPITASQPLWDAFRSILHESMGLKNELIQDNTLRIALRDLSATVGGNPSIWLESLKSDPVIRHKFCEHFTVGETWFFRDWTPFACLRQFAEEFRLRKGTTRPIRVLSIPCSTGQEPWSMAMLFAWMGWTPDQVIIDALDLNRASLKTMKERTYKKYSFRETQPEANLILDRFTRPISDGFEVDPGLANFVHIHHGNILDHQLDPTGCGAKYDVIFSRNLFIYLDNSSRSKAMTNLMRLLDPEGILYFGHAEGSVIEGHGLVSWNSAFNFAFTRKAAKPGLVDSSQGVLESDIGRVTGGHLSPLPPKSRPHIQPKPKASPISPTEGNTKNPVKRSVPGSRSSRITKAPLVDPVAKALAAANSGDLENAAYLYADLLKKEAMNGNLWRMAAVVEQARGRTEEALKMFDRALYIDSKDRESLRMASLIRRQRGEIARAEQLERRLAALDLTPGNEYPESRTGRGEK